MPEINCERDKYLWIYSYPKTSYGKTNHGRNAYPIIKRLAPATLLDVGCGKGQFVEWANSQGIKAVGIIGALIVVLWAVNDFWYYDYFGGTMGIWWISEYFW